MMPHDRTLLSRPHLPEWLKRAALSVLEDAYYRRGPFAAVPPGVLDRAVRAMPPPPGVTTEEVRRICFESRNAMATRYGVEPHPASEEVLYYVLRRTPLLVPDEREERYFRLNRKAAERHLRALQAGGEAFEDVEVSVEAGLTLSSRDEVGPVSLRTRVWAPYKPAPVIQSRLSFHMEGGDELFAIGPKCALSDEESAGVWFEREFEPVLLKQLGYARLVRDAALKAVKRQLPVH